MIKNPSLAQGYWAEAFSNLRSQVQNDPHADWSAQLTELCTFTIGLLEADDVQLYILRRTNEAEQED